MFESSVPAQNAAAGSSLGALLLAAREERGVPLEQAARDTRIRAQRLCEIESDDLSHFSHPSYARLFLVDYAKYLGISLQEIRPYLPDFGQCGAEGYQYLQEIPGPPTASRIARRLQPRRRLLPVFAGLFVIGVCTVVGIQVWMFMRNVDRIQLGQVAQVEKSGLQHENSQAVRAEVIQAVPVGEKQGPVTPDAVSSPGQPQANSGYVDDHEILFVGGAFERQVQ